jgi:transposase
MRNVVIKCRFLAGSAHFCAQIFMTLCIVDVSLRFHPSQYGLEGNLWDGKLLSYFIAKQFGVEFGVQQCQRLFRRFGFRLRKARPLIAKADPEKQGNFKKNC